ncbi:hypothetical protein HOK021_68290 [Streptomyces hygroscopicus]|nr:hypothetical protein HOK021_68290 [Streptomyces hygroscopicus]
MPCPRTGLPVRVPSAADTLRPLPVALSAPSVVTLVERGLLSVTVFGHPDGAPEALLPRSRASVASAGHGLSNQSEGSSAYSPMTTTLKAAVAKTLTARSALPTT